MSSHASVSPPDVSVISPVYNGADFLVDALNSVQHQAGVRVEHILVDDGSTDATWEILTEAASQPTEHKVITIRQENSGESAAVNRGVELARAQYCVILNADDRLKPNVLSTLLNGLDGTRFGVVYPNYEVIDSVGNVVHLVRNADYSIDLLLGDASCLPSVGSMFRKEIFDPGRARDPSLRYVSDFEMWLRAALKCEFLHVDEYLAQWRQHPMGTTSRVSNCERALELVDMIDTFVSGNQSIPEIRRLHNQATSMVRYKAAIALRNEDTKVGMRLMFESLCIPFRRSRASRFYRRRARTVAGTLLGMAYARPRQMGILWNHFFHNSRQGE